MIWHLACLALIGKIKALKSYQNSLETNKVTQYATSYFLFSCVNRAVEFAEEHFIPCRPSEKENFIRRMMSSHETSTISFFHRYVLYLFTKHSCFRVGNTIIFVAISFNLFISKYKSDTFWQNLSR